jgi:hypothetical protein
MHAPAASGGDREGVAACIPNTDPKIGVCQSVDIGSQDAGIGRPSDLMPNMQGDALDQAGHGGLTEDYAPVRDGEGGSIRHCRLFHTDREGSALNIGTETHIANNLTANSANFPVTKKQQEWEAKYRAALRFAEASLPVVPLKLSGGKEYQAWKLAVPAGTPGSIDPAQLEAWFMTNPDWEIAIAPPEGLVCLEAYETKNLKVVENYYSPLPPTLTLKSRDPKWPDRAVYLFRSPGETYNIASLPDIAWGTFLNLRFVTSSMSRLLPGRL